MSTATEGTPNSQASGPGAAPASPATGALALLAASAVGSYLASRSGTKPLVVAAGATLLAWLNHKKSHAGSPVPPPVAETPPLIPAAAAPVPDLASLQPTPAPQPTPPAAPSFPSASIAPPPVLSAPADPAMDPRIQAWLARQMDREERAAAQEHITLNGQDASPSPSADFPWLRPEAAHAEPNGLTPAAFAPATEEEPAPSLDASAREAHDDYRPEPLVADPSAEAQDWQAHTFAGLTEPLPASSTAPLESFQAEPPLPEATSADTEPEPAPPPAAIQDPLRPVFSTAVKPPHTAPLTTASAIPGIEPLPSWTESTERHPQPPSFPSAMPPISTAPPPVAAIDLESLFNTPAFGDSPPSDESHVTAPVAAAAAPFFTAAPDALSKPPVFQTIPSDPATPASPPWLAPANSLLFTEAPPGHAAEPPSPPPQPNPPPFEDDPIARLLKTPQTMEAAAPFSFPEESNGAGIGMAGSEPTPTSPVPEIAVHVAAAGEAWFDPPLAGAAGVPNPWLPPQDDVQNGPPPLPSKIAPLRPAQPPTPVMEAEVVLRPRAPTQSSVVAKKQPPAAPQVVDHDSVPHKAPSPTSTLVDPPSPEPRTHTTWKSWWKGD